MSGFSYAPSGDATRDTLTSAISASMAEFQDTNPGYRSASARYDDYDADARSLTGHLDLCLEDGSHVVLHVVATMPADGTFQVAANQTTHSDEAYWEWVIAAGLAPHDLVIGHRLYRVLPESDQGMRGFAGHSFRIRVLPDGPEFTTTNLWAGMTVPPAFREQLPDTAEFVADPDGAR